MHSRTELIGSVDGSPQISEHPSGLKFTTFKLVTRERKKTLDGDWADFIETHRIEFYGITAQYIFDNVTPNSIVMVIGQNKNHVWVDDNNQEYYSTVVEGNEFKPLWIDKSNTSATTQNDLKFTVVDEDIQLIKTEAPIVQQRPQFEDNKIPPDTFDDDIHHILDKRYINIHREEHE